MRGHGHLLFYLVKLHFGCLTYRILSIVEPKKEARNFRTPRTSFNAPNLNAPRSIMDKILIERSRLFSSYGDSIQLLLRFFFHFYGGINHFYTSLHHVPDLKAAICKNVAVLRHDCSIIVINDVSLSAQLLCMVKKSCVGFNCICRTNITYYYEKVKNKF